MKKLYLAIYLLINFNQNLLAVSPCDDFFTYVNGEWVEKTEIPAKYGSYGTFHEMHENNQQKLRKILEKGSSDASLLYQSLMREDITEKSGEFFLKNLFHRIDQITSMQQLQEYLAFAATHYAHTPLISIEVDSDLKNSKQNIAYIWQSKLSLPEKSFYFDKNKEDVLRLLLDQMTKVFSHFNIASELASKVIEIEKKLAEVSLSRLDLRSPENSYHIVDRKELKKFSHLNLNAWLKAIGVSTSKLSLAHPKYYERLDQLMQHEEIANWQAYLKWHAFVAFAPYLTKNLKDLHFELFGKGLQGRKERLPHWEFSISVVDELAKDLLSKQYAEQYFSPQAKQAAETLVFDLIEVYRERISNSTWMGDKTKSRALKKLDTMQIKIGYPNRWETINVKLNIDDPLGNLQKLAQYHFQTEIIDKIDKPIDRQEWRMGSHTVNAYYNPSLNEIVFPAAILQPPFFALDYSFAKNFGGIGTIIGHEISHAFDDEGSQFDELGQLENWWTQEDRNEFTKRAQLIVEQYNKYEVLPGLFLNGQLTLGENIADIAGLTVAIQAFKKRNKAISQEMLLSDLSELFRSFAQNWKSKQTETLTRTRAVTDPHSDPKYRTNGSIIHQPDFYKVFSCPTAGFNSSFEIW